MQIFLAASLMAGFAALNLGAQSLSNEALKLLRDAGGWEYLTLNIPGAAVPTDHPCFDGTPHPDQCRGVLVFTPGNRFTQAVTIQGKTVRRTGTYQLDGNQVTFVDELAHTDGPYTLALDTAAKTLTLDMPQIHQQLLLETEFLEQQRRNRKAP